MQQGRKSVSSTTNVRHGNSCVTNYLFGIDFILGQDVSICIISILMGNILRTLMGSLANKNMEVVLIGLENSGKTTLLQVLSGDNPVETVPTIGLSIKQVRLGGVVMKCWDLGGQAQYRSEWARYTKGCNAIIFVVDSQNIPQIPDVKMELHRLLEHSELQHTPILVLSNKIDLTPHISETDLVKGLNLDYIVDNPWAVIPCSALKNINIVECNCFPRAPLKDVLTHHLCSEFYRILCVAFCLALDTSWTSIFLTILGGTDGTVSTLSSARSFCLMLEGNTVSASQLTRQASSQLLRVALSPSVASPDTLLSALEGMADTLAPVLSALLSGAVLRMGLRFPLDSSLPLALVALLGTLLYLSSLLLQVRFRGDFGVMSDQAVRRERMDGRSGCCYDLLRVPRADIALLFSPIGAGYGAAMFHLKGELKDV
eukprot:gene7690-15739_t